MLWRNVTSVGLVRRLMVPPFRNGLSVQHVPAAAAIRVDRPYATHQDGLPHLPVPPLPQTLDKFLHSMKPILSTDEFKDCQKCVSEFGREGGHGSRLQKMLENFASSRGNWLSEWWQNLAYLENRDAVAINVNPGIITPLQPCNSQNEQLILTAKLISGLLEYKELLDIESLPVEKLGGSPLCMSQFFTILGTCRVPGAKRDLVYEAKPNTSTCRPKHAIVMYNNHLYKVDVFGTNCQSCSTQQIYEQLQRVIKDSPTDRAPALGVLTAGNRDRWYSAYSLMCKSKHNRSLFEVVHSAITVIALDGPMPKNANTNIESIMANASIHGYGTKHASGNRWFDKILQLAVSEDGLISATYEHSTAEGPPVISTVDHCMGFLKSGKEQTIKAKGVVAPRRLDFDIPAEVHTAIDESSQELDKLISDLNLIAFKFDKFGKNFIKSQKLSPDAFIQVAFQLAYYRLYGQNVASYESGSLRKFLHGRTDTIRSCTVATSAYCRAMVDSSTSSAERVHLLRDAVLAHRKYTDEVINGRGIDRHLLGLKLISMEKGEDLSEFHKSQYYQRGQYWQISTSQVASSSGGLLCFGPVVPDGYGFCYNPMNDSIFYAVSSWHHHKDTDSSRMKASIESALMEAQEALLSEAKL